MVNAICKLDEKPVATLDRASLDKLRDGDRERERERERGDQD